MTVPALALVPVLLNGTGTGESFGTLDAELVARAARDDYQQWLATTAPANGCVRPIRLSGPMHDVDSRTGEVLSTRDTRTLPDHIIYTACGDRRASVCPSCAETYRRDTYQLVRAGLAGGKGVPESVAIHPAVFATFTAPSFGPVHTKPLTSGGKIARCRPRRHADFCSHGRRMSCGQRHKDTDACLGRPLCADCYDYEAAVVWNAHAPEPWRRTTIAIRRRLNRLTRDRSVRVRLSYTKVAEFQARGLAHFHAIFRLDGDDPARVVPPPVVTAAQLADAIHEAVRATRFATVSHPARPLGWVIGWGRQLDTRTVRVTNASDLTDTAVASYLAKYSTKSTEAVATVSVRICDGNVNIYGSSDSHQGRLISAAWRIGNHPHADFQALRRWAHMLGYRGHFATKSRRYSTTLRALRAARTDWKRRQHLRAHRLESTVAVVVASGLVYAGRGWQTAGDALLALSEAVRAREHQRVAREELTSA